VTICEPVPDCPSTTGPSEGCPQLAVTRTAEVNSNIKFDLVPIPQLYRQSGLFYIRILW